MDTSTSDANAVAVRLVCLSSGGVSQVQKPPGAFNLQILQPVQLNLFARRDLIGLFWPNEQKIPMKIKELDMYSI